MWSPFGQVPANGTASWKSGPDERGTLSILTTCLITLLLCVYSTLLLNIPEHGRTKWTHLARRKAGWVCVGLLAPEVVGYFAFQDWLFSKAFERRMKRFLVCESTSKSAPQDETTTNAPARRRFPWTQLHSHYALMGGYVFDTSDASANFLPNKRTRVTLTPDALLKIAELEPDMIPDLSKGDIQDKSKADGLAKTIVCIQALWFLAQTVGRLATGNPISLLEMNTLLHALCCLAIYAAWWHKPLDIEEPSLVDSSSAEHNKQMAALLLMYSKMGEIKRQYPTTSDFLILMEEIEPPNDARSSAIRIAKSACSKEGRPPSVLPDQCHVDPVSGTFKLHYGQEIFGYRLCAEYNDGDIDRKDYSVYLTTEDIECLRLANLFRQRTYPCDSWRPSELLEKDFLVPCASFSRPTNASLNELRDKRPISLLDQDSTDILFVMALSAAGSFYGGLHLLAWNAPFPTRAERLIWRISGIAIAAPFPILVLLPTMAVVISLPLSTVLWLHDCVIARTTRKRIASFWKRKRVEYPMRHVQNAVSRTWKGIAPIANFVRKIFYGFFVVVPMAIVLLYLIARVYLVVECFINLAHLPDAVYKEPEWSKVLPHLGSG